MTTTTYLISLGKKAAALYDGKPNNHMSMRAAVKRFAPDAIIVSYCGTGHIAKDLLKIRSAGEAHLSQTELSLIAEVKVPNT